MTDRLTARSRFRSAVFEIAAAVDKGVKNRGKPKDRKETQRFTLVCLSLLSWIAPLLLQWLPLHRLLTWPVGLAMFCVQKSEKLEKQNDSTGSNVPLLVGRFRSSFITSLSATLVDNREES